MMSDFTPIETQEAFDEAIKSRLNRSEQKWAEKYSGYLSPDDVKNQTDELNLKIAELGNSLNAATEKASADAQTISDLEKRVKNYETASVKSRIAHEVGLPYELANRLSGETEEEIKADAEALVKTIGKNSTPPPLFNADGGENNTREAAMKKMLHDLH